MDCSFKGLGQITTPTEKKVPKFRLIDRRLLGCRKSFFKTPHMDASAGNYKLPCFCLKSSGRVFSQRPSAYSLNNRGMDTAYEKNSFAYFQKPSAGRR